MEVHDGAAAALLGETDAVFVVGADVHGLDDADDFVRNVVRIATESVLSQKSEAAVGSRGPHVDDEEDVHDFLIVNDGEAVFHETRPSLPEKLFAAPVDHQFHRVGFDDTNFLEEGQLLVFARSQEGIFGNDIPF